MLEDNEKLVFSNDPFREEDHGEEIFNTPNYTLNIHPGALVPHDKPKEDDKSQEVHIEENGERSLKNIFKDAGRQIVASLVILVIGFFALNWSAYYQIAKNKWDGYTGVSNSQNLTQLIERNPVTESQVVLETSGDIDIQKKQIPDLNLEVMPIDTRLVIPRINQNIPIVGVSSKNLVEHDWNALEKDMQEALKKGVIHYPGTSYPGQKGNIVITGHSSYFPWDPGRFKDVFALLHQMKIGDKVMIYYNQEKYVYEVTETKVVLPSNIDVLKQTPDDKLTLITCTPVGTNLKRLIVTAKPITEEKPSK
ncbi:MAG: class D sortase [Candidatus Gracilibacteria bacterium]